MSNADAVAGALPYLWRAVAERHAHDRLSTERRRPRRQMLRDLRDRHRPEHRHQCGMLTEQVHRLIEHVGPLCVATFATSSGDACCVLFATFRSMPSCARIDPAIRTDAAKQDVIKRITAAVSALFAVWVAF